MKITTTGKNIVVTEKIQDEIEKRFSKIDKFFTDDIQAKVVMHPQQAKVKVEATIATKGTIFRAEDVEQDIFDAIDTVAEKLLTQMSKHKKKLIKRNQSKESVRFEMLPEVPEEEINVVKTKKFILTPMTTDEAILQMELLQHTFFVFLSEDTGKVNVVYKRKNEDYGLLETEH